MARALKQGGSLHKRYDKVQKLDLAKRAFEMRLHGKSYPDIAAELGIALSTAHKYITERINAEIQPAVEEVRQLEVDRLNLYLDRLQARVNNGDVQAIQTALKVAERRARLLGIDAPQQLQVEAAVVELTPAELELAEMLREAKARARAEETALGGREPAVAPGAEDIVEGELVEDSEPANGHVAPAQPAPPAEESLVERAIRLAQGGGGRAKRR